MADLRYILSEEEYTNLQQSKPNIFLQKRVEELEKELEKYQIYKRSLELDGDQLAEAVAEPIVPPFSVNDDAKLAPTSTELFVSIYNNLSAERRCATLKHADVAYFEFITRLATVSGYEASLLSTSEVKRYRVSLYKDGTYKSKGASIAPTN